MIDLVLARSTGPEIWAQCRGQLHAFVMGAGTGGTIAGVSSYFRRASQSLGGRFLTFMRYGVRSAHRAVKIVLVDPPGSSLYNRVKHGVCYTPQQAERKLRRHRYV
jgi:cysteine synthase A